MTSPILSEKSFKNNTNNRLNNSSNQELSFSSPNFEDLSREFNVKIRSGKPLLLPPKDYSNTQRDKDQLDKAENWRSLNPLIVGGNEALVLKEKNFERIHKDHFKAPCSEPDLNSQKKTGTTKSLCEETIAALKY